MYSSQRKALCPINVESKFFAQTTPIKPKIAPHDFQGLFTIGLSVSFLHSRFLPVSK